MLARPALDRDLHRALVESGLAPLTEYVEMYDMSEDVPATADPVGLPWVMEFREFGVGLAGEYFSGVKDAAGKTVRVKGFALGGGDRVDDALANTAAIVEAVNSHAALVAENERLRETLRESILQIEYLHNKFKPTGSGICVVFRARAALGDKP